MKNKYAFLVVVSSICFLGLGSLGYTKNNSEGKLKLSLNSSKKIYKPGENVFLSLELQNKSKEIVTFPDVFGIGGGLLSVHLSNDGKTFQNYNHPGWGLLDFVNPPLTTIKPGESVGTTTTVLWKWRGTDKSEYAFPTAGAYYLQAKYLYDNVVVNGQIQPILAESEPIKITIEEPVGDDLEVWNKIKDNGDFALFIQEGDVRIPSYKSEERAKFLQEVEQILTEHPNSFYAQSLRQSLYKFRAAEAKRQEFLQKMQKQKEKPQ